MLSLFHTTHNWHINLYHHYNGDPKTKNIGDPIKWNEWGVRNIDMEGRGKGIGTAALVRSTDTRLHDQ